MILELKGLTQETLIIIIIITRPQSPYFFFFFFWLCWVFIAMRRLFVVVCAIL